VEEKDMAKHSGPSMCNTKTEIAPHYSDSTASSGVAESETKLKEITH